MEINILLMRLIRGTTLKTLSDNLFPLVPVTQMIIFQFDLTNFMQASLLLPLQGQKLYEPEKQ